MLFMRLRRECYDSEWRRKENCHSSNLPISVVDSAHAYFKSKTRTHLLFSWHLKRQNYEETWPLLSFVKLLLKPFTFPKTVTSVYIPPIRADALSESEVQ